MGFTLDQVVPWGRSYDEYVAMFALTPQDLSSRLLGCGDGPAAFNAELTCRGGDVVSVDPIYAYSASQIRERIALSRQTVMEQLRANAADYIWTHIPDLQCLERIRLAAMEVFLQDYETGRLQNRYVCGGLPLVRDVLSKKMSPRHSDGSHRFDLALSSHFLFLYSQSHSTAFHVEATREMLRVAREIRVFPLVSLDGRPSPHVEPVIQALRADGHAVHVQRVNYEFQRGASHMLVARRA